MEEREWYLLRDGKRYGPFSEADLDRFTYTKQLLPTDLLWHDGVSEWQSAAFFKPQSQRLQELQEAKTRRSAPPPVSPAPTPALAPPPALISRAVSWLTAPRGNIWLRIAIQVAVVLCVAVLIGVGSGYAYRYLVE